MSRVIKQRGLDMNVKYDKDLDILLIKLREVDHLDYAEEYGDVIIHFEGNRPAEIEILNASKILKALKE